MAYRSLLVVLLLLSLAFLWALSGSVLSELHSRASQDLGLLSIDSALQMLRDCVFLYLPLSCLIGVAAELRARVCQLEQSHFAVGLLAVPLAPAYYCCLASMAWAPFNGLVATIYGLLGFPTFLAIIISQIRHWRNQKSGDRLEG